jgi:hypothetical protein
VTAAASESILGKAPTKPVCIGFVVQVCSLRGVESQWEVSDPRWMLDLSRVVWKL